MVESAIKCCAILNFWDASELLPYVVKQWHKIGIDVIIVYSNRSNYGEYVDNKTLLKSEDYWKCHIIQCEPMMTMPVVENERMKRNFGLDYAREKKYTHFITSDCDEMYEDFTYDFDWSLIGTVVPCQTYFADPTLTIGLDTTLVPFIHRLTPTITHQWNKRYPFAWEGASLRIDPTRQMNINSGVIYNPKIVMHHYSYVRKDIDQKIRNSTARTNIERSDVRQEMMLAEDGYYVKFYGKKLHTVPNRFNLPTWRHSGQKSTHSGGNQPDTQT